MKKIICIALFFVMALSCFADVRDTIFIADAKEQNFGSHAPLINEIYISDFATTKKIVRPPLNAVAFGNAAKWITKGDKEYKKNNFKKAAHYYKKAASKGNSEAQYKLGLMYYFEQDYAKAKTLFEKAVAQNNYHAQEYLGNLYWYGFGVKKDIAKAEYWLKKAGENAAGDANEIAKHTYNHIATFYLFIMKDKAQAKYWLEKEAEAGSYSAKKFLESEAFK